MKLSVCLPMFFKKTPLDVAIRSAFSLGYNAAELWSLPKDVDVDAVAAACNECSFTLVAFCPDKFNMTDSALHGEYLESLEKACITANKLNVKRLITQVGPDTGAPRETQHNNIVSCLKLADPILKKYGVTLVVEPLNTIVDHKGYYLVHSAEGFDIIREVNSDNVKLLFDIYHQQISEGNVISNVVENLNLIGHLHCAGNPGRNEPWLGELNYNGIFKAIDEAGYTGYCALEYKPTLDPKESLLKCKELYK